MPTPTFRTISFSLAALAGAALFGPRCADAGSPRRVNYSRDIRPILSNSCYKCHGPDQRERKAGLRLDTKQGAYGEARVGRRGHRARFCAAKSAMIQRLTSHDADEQDAAARLGQNGHG